MEGERERISSPPSGLSSLPGALSRAFSGAPCDRNPARPSATSSLRTPRFLPPSSAALSGWNLPDCAELTGDLLRIDFEGVFFARRRA
ncbi:MAG: hypothetical protein V8Q84_02615 [Bilophila sp.]